ncbi:MAG: DNA polymerase [Proteobacteria bacterium]|jgi:predicted nucleotidyltransferase|nr:DNA polymerase [Pseudomonadota bacterium]
MPTALELGRQGWQRYLKAARHRPKPLKLTLSERKERQELLDRIAKAAAAIKKRCSAHRVILFGSLAHEAWFSQDSDVDLAVEGLVGDDYWLAWRLAEDIIANRPVDLIDLETSGESLKRAIQRYGVEL